MIHRPRRSIVMCDRTFSIPFQLFDTAFYCSVQSPSLIHSPMSVVTNTTHVCGLDTKLEPVRGGGTAPTAGPPSATYQNHACCRCWSCASSRTASASSPFISCRNFVFSS